MRKTREQIEYQLSIKRNRLELYLKREAEMLDGGVQSYAGRRVPKYVSSAEGNSRTLTISSRPLMIPNNKNPFIVADVLTD